MRRFSYFNNDAYLHFEPLHDLSCLQEITSDAFLCSNVNVRVSTFKRLLYAHNIAHCTTSTDSLRYGAGFLLMLPQRDHYDKTKLVDLVEGFMEKFPGMPYYAYIEKHGKGTYIYIYVCDRKFFARKKKVYEHHTHDSYRDPNTGRLCSKDTEGAIKVVSKGDIRNSYDARFSKKYSYFKFASEKEFQFKIAELKNLWIDLCSKILQEKIEESVTIPKLQRNGHTKRQMKIISIYNKAIKKAEDKLNESVEVLKFMGQFDKHSKKIIANIVSRIRNIFNCGSFRIGRVKVKIKNYLDMKKVYDTADLFVRKTFEIINSVMNKLCSPDPDFFLL